MHLAVEAASVTPPTALSETVSLSGFSCLASLALEKLHSF
jgi:hypothetical protein